MAPSRGKALNNIKTKTYRSNEPSATDKQQIYREMLAEANSTPTSSDVDGRAFKRRRTTPIPQGSPLIEQSPENSATYHSTLPQQVVYDDSPSSDSEDEGLDFEDVELEGDVEIQPVGIIENEQSKDLSINLDQELKPRPRAKSSKRTPVSAIEKKRRIDVHKVHLCLLLVYLRKLNSWCNDDDVQDLVRPMLTKRTASYLNPESTLSQFQRSRSFQDGLEQATTAWLAVFKTTENGTRRPKWDLDVLSLENCSTEPPVAIDISVFIERARSRSGTRDEGAQLFCALLRSVDVDARLVCSLQPLPFTNPVSTNMSTSASEKQTVYANAQSQLSPARTAETSRSQPTDTSRIKRFGGRSTANGSHLDLGEAPKQVAMKTKKILDSAYPVFWVEAFNKALQKWIPVDPLVTRSIAKPSKFEPPLSDPLNNMSYVISFDRTGYARDVTRRYCKAYNAKTRRSRVESTKGGVKWWRNALRPFQRAYVRDRDQLEEAELSHKEAQEPMPRNVLDFKDHPIYALERHLGRDEAIHPKDEIGKVSVGKAAADVEPIFRRKDVKLVQSADKWYRVGREVKPGQQPLKYGSKKRKQHRTLSPDSQEEEAVDEGRALYAEFQTEMYMPPVVVQGRIPKNQYGNLDVYVASMIPPGAVYIRAAEALQAAKIVGVDYARAVTGFRFKGRRGEAVFDGVVVAAEYRVSIEQVIQALRTQAEEEAARKQSLTVLRLWKRFFIGLQIQDQVKAYEGGKVTVDIAAQIDEAEDKDQLMAEAGGFFAEAGEASGTDMLDNDAASDDTYSVGVPLEALLDDDNAQKFQLPATIEDMTVVSPWDNPSSTGADGDNKYHDQVEKRPERLLNLAGQEQTLHDSKDEDHKKKSDGQVDENLAGGFLHDESPEPGDLHQHAQHTHPNFVGSPPGGGFFPESPNLQAMRDGDGATASDARQSIAVTATPNALTTPETIATSDEARKDEAEDSRWRGSGTTNIAASSASNSTRHANDPASIKSTRSCSPRPEGNVFQSPMNHHMGQPAISVIQDSEGSNDRLGESIDVSNREDKSMGSSTLSEREGEADEVESLLSHDPDDDDAEPDWLGDVSL